MIETYQIERYKYCTLNRFQAFGSDVLESLDTKLKGGEGSVEEPATECVDQKENGGGSIRDNVPDQEILHGGYSQDGSQLAVDLIIGGSQSHGSVSESTGASRQHSDQLNTEEIDLKSAHLRLMGDNVSLSRLIVDEGDVSFPRAIQDNSDSSQATVNLNDGNDFGSGYDLPNSIDIDNNYGIPTTQSSPSVSNNIGSITTTTSNIESNINVDEYSRANEIVHHEGNKNKTVKTLVESPLLTANITTILNDINNQSIPNLIEQGKDNTTTAEDRTAYNTTVKMESNQSTTESRNTVHRISPHNGIPSIPIPPVTNGHATVPPRGVAGPSLLGLVDRVAQIEERSRLLGNLTGDLSIGYRYLNSHVHQTIETQSIYVQSFIQMVGLLYFILSFSQ